jgi:serine/threonine protein kinase
MIGQMLKGRYKIYDRVAEGSAKMVYLARDSESGQVVVVKVLHDYLANGRFVSQFEREIDLLQRIDNPHVVHIYDWAIQEKQPDSGRVLSYIITEFVKGRTLANIIDIYGKIEEKAALAIARQIAQGLAAIHNEGFIHQDVRSQHIMITPDQAAKLIDFGFAKHADQATLSGRGMFIGMFVGKSYYAPPEQIMEAQNIDHRADIYALGIVLFEMLTARLPDSGKFGTVVAKILSRDLDLEPLRGVSVPVEELVTEMVAYNAADRPASAKVVIERIEEILGENPPPPVTNVVGRRVEVSPNNLYAHLRTSTGMSIPLTRKEVVIGRSAPKDPNIPDIDLWSLCVPDARTVSRRHFRVYRQGHQYFIEDLCSMSGTSVNRIRIQPEQPHPLKNGDMIRAGRVVMTFRDEPD